MPYSQTSMHEMSKSLKIQEFLTWIEVKEEDRDDENTSL